MFNIKLEEKSYKMSFKALLVKIQRSKTDSGEGHNPGADRIKRVLTITRNSSVTYLSNNIWKRRQNI